MVLMSATLNAELFAQYFDAPAIMVSSEIEVTNAIFYLSIHRRYPEGCLMLK